jgi:hypothetical protein
MAAIIALIQNLFSMDASSKEKSPSRRERREGLHYAPLIRLGNILGLEPFRTAGNVESDRIPFS